MKKNLCFFALAGSLMAVSAYAQETTRADATPRVAHPEIGVTVGPTVSTDDTAGWGPYVAVFGSGVIYKGLHLGPELGYALQGYRSNFMTDVRQHRFSGLARLEWHIGGDIPVIQWLSLGAKAGAVYTYRTIEVLGYEADRDDWAFGFGPSLGINIPVVPSFTIGAEGSVLFMSSENFTTAVNMGLNARIWL